MPPTQDQLEAQDHIPKWAAERWPSLHFCDGNDGCVTHCVMPQSANCHCRDDSGNPYKLKGAE